MYTSPQKIASTLIASAMPTSSTRRSRSSSVSPEVAPMVTKGASGRAIICGRWYPAGAWDAGCRQRLYWSGRGESLEIYGPL